MTARVRIALILCVAIPVCLAETIRVEALAQQVQDQLASPKLRISWDAFKKLYDADEIVVVDVRDPASYERGHIPGARNVPLGALEKQIDWLKKASKPIVLYCA